MPNFTLEYVGGVQPALATWVDDHPGGSRLNTPRFSPGHRRLVVGSLPATIEVNARVGGVLGPTDLAVLSRFEWHFAQRGQGGPPVLSVYDPLRSSKVRFDVRPDQLGLWVLVARRVPRRQEVTTILNGTDTLTVTEEAPPDGTQVFLRRGASGVFPTVVGDALSESVGYYTRDKAGGGPWTVKLARTLGGAAIDLTSNGTLPISMQPGADDTMGSGWLGIGFCVEPS